MNNIGVDLSVVCYIMLIRALSSMLHKYVNNSNHKLFCLNYRTTELTCNGVQ